MVCIRKTGKYQAQSASREVVIEDSLIHALIGLKEQKARLAIAETQLKSIQDDQDKFKRDTEFKISQIQEEILQAETNAFNRQSEVEDAVFGTSTRGGRCFTARAFLILFCGIENPPQEEAQKFGGACRKLKQKHLVNETYPNVYHGGYSVNQWPKSLCIMAAKSLGYKIKLED